MTYTVEAVTKQATVSYGSGRQKPIRGFAVCSSPGRAIRWFMQGTAQKWSAAVEQSLRQQAADWAKTLNDRATA